MKTCLPDRAVCVPPLSNVVTSASRSESARFLGIDVGAETIKLVEVVRENGALRWSRRALVEHRNTVGAHLMALLEDWHWAGVSGASATGKGSRLLELPGVPVKQAQIAGARHLLGAEPLTVVSIGSHGFSVLEITGDGLDAFRENSRCSQGTGNFLRQLVGRFSLSVEDASDLCASVQHPAVLSGRCPVILKTDMTHLANKGEDRGAILAGLFDAVCENVLVLIKPGRCPRRVALIGGVTQSERVRRTMAQRLQAMELELLPGRADDARYFEALGCALLAAASPTPVPPLDAVMKPAVPASFERVPGLEAWRGKVRRLRAPEREGASAPTPPAAVVLGFDIGSTGSKITALDAVTHEPRWENYRATAGDPVGAAQALLQAFTQSAVGTARIAGLGVTGSGREIVGSLMTACYGKDAVFVLNEIAAHAAGAHFHDPRVDTIFEIGGQDAKYIRVADGRVTDCAMNEACSAGTGSFIEEQGRKFSGMSGVAQLAEEALRASEVVSLGQHCSVFMAEVIDEAVAAGAATSSIIAGLYDSVIQNYLNRVKGSRSVGQVIFCQGMPFASDALAAAVARQTGAEVIVPPNPGTVGALGIALLAVKAGVGAATAEIVPTRFLEARVEGKDTFQCQAKVGCGGVGNRCRIERLRTVVAGKTLGFTWGGGCALHDKATRRRKLPDLAPDPFREREALVRELLAPRTGTMRRRRMAMTDEFALKGLFPFFVTFLQELDFEILAVNGGDHADLKRGIADANVPFCAPMQLYHGIAARMAAAGADAVFLPLLHSMPRVGKEKHAVTCPIVQASPDLVRWDLAALERVPVVSPVIRIGAAGLRSPELAASCHDLAASLGFAGGVWRLALERAISAQQAFEQRARELGARALTYCREHGIVPVVVMGRPYTMYNPVLNSNVPAILREQGAIGIPLDCYPVADDVPTFGDMYWGWGQRILRAAHQVRRTPGEYSLYCSNYACGPDSFTLHFYAHAMDGKPSAIIETDGHSGDAGTKTRVEAFLHCVEQDRGAATATEPHDFTAVQVSTVRLSEILARRERVLIPWMGDGSHAVAAALRGRGIRAESLPPPGREALRAGRRHTSGKECLPMALTLGGLLQRLEQARDDETFVYFMSSTNGPCRFGVYNLLNQIVLQRLGWSGRVRIWSPRDSGYFDEFPPAFGMVTLAGLLAADLLGEVATALRAEELRPGAVTQVYKESLTELLALIERRAGEDISTPAALWQVAGGSLFGIRALLERAADRFTHVRASVVQPTVLVVGEIYVRSVPFANGYVADELTRRGLRVRLAPVQEWLEYCDYNATRDRVCVSLSSRLADAVRTRIRRVAMATIDERLGWPARHETHELLVAAAPYLRKVLRGEAVLTLGGPLCGWRHGQIDGVLSVGPHECMPNKIAESQLAHISKDEGLPSVTVPVNGDPTDSAVLDNFAYEVHSRFRERHGQPVQVSTRGARRSVRARAMRKVG